jgi:type II secretory pathway component PulK
MMRRASQHHARRRQSGFALLLTMMVLTVLMVVVAHVTARVGVALARSGAHVLERQCRRALESTVGFAVRGLTEDVEDLRTDHFGDQWCRPKIYMVGDVQVEIRIEDCARRYDLKPLLEENAERLEENKEQFIAFASYCGLDELVARQLANTIAEEAEIRRLEDEVKQEAEPAEDEDAEAAALINEAGTVPNWLEDYLSLPQLSEEDRHAILAAQVMHMDPVTLEEVTVRLVDLLTIWRYDKLNINTAGREVLLFGIPGMSEREDDVDALLLQRREEPFLSLAAVQGQVSLDRDQVIQITKACGLASKRFRVTATATFLNRKLPPGMRPGRMTLIIERTGNNTFKTLWRQLTL